MNRLIPLALSFAVAFSAVAPGILMKSPAFAQPATQTQPAKPKVKVATPAAPKKEEQPEKATEAEIDASIASAIQVDPLTLLQNPQAYLNKKVTFTGTFNRFADIALDYKKAFRDSRDYVTFFILRPDVTHSTIPLSELK
ncbi:MAG TPA: hypothetical protein V6C99_00915, partial [Oculatellaceae cyanobacterium]